MKTFRLTRAFLSLFVLIFASLACSLSSPPAIGEVVVAESLDADFKPVNPTSTYSSDDTIISISVEVQNIEVGSVVEVKYKLDGAEFNTISKTADQSGSGYYGFTLTFENGITPGSYVADAYLDGQLAKSVSFTVAASGPPTIVSAVTAKDFDESFKPIEPTSAYAPGDTFHISVQVKNIAVGNTITVKYAYEGTPVPEVDTTLTADQAGSGYYGFTLEPPTEGFPAGSYAVEVYLNDTLFNTIAFAVQ